MRANAIGAAIFLALGGATAQTALAQDAPTDSQIDPAISELFPDMPRMNKLLDALITDRKGEKTDPADSGAPEAKIDKDYSGSYEVYGEAERQAAFLEVKRQGQAALAARNDEYFREFAAIRAEDASALKFLSTQCTNNDDPSGDCMNDVSRARKVDQRMQLLLAKEGAADFLAKKVKTAWRPESPIRAAAVKMPTESNTGLQAARDYVAKHSFRDSSGGFLGCHAKRAAVVALRGDDMRPADAIDEYATYLWDQNSLVRDLAAIETSGAQDTPVNAYRICVLRARWAELGRQKQSPPPLTKLADPSAGIALTKPEVLTRTGTASGKALIESGIQRLGAWEADRGPREARERAERAEMERKNAEASRQYAELEAKRAAQEERNRQRAANGGGFDLGGLLLGVAQAYVGVKQTEQQAQSTFRAPPNTPPAGSYAPPAVRSYTPPPPAASPTAAGRGPTRSFKDPATGLDCVTFTGWEYRNEGYSKHAMFKNTCGLIFSIRARAPGRSPRSNGIGEYGTSAVTFTRQNIDDFNAPWVFTVE